MRYTLLITAVGNPRAQKIVAHNLAGNRSISLSYAQSLLENLPLAYQTDLTSEDAHTNLKRLTAIGVQAHIVPASLKSESPKEIKEAPDLPPPSATSEAKEQEQSTPEMVPILRSALSFIPKKDGTLAAPEKQNRPNIRLAVIGIVVIVFFAVALFFYTGKKWRMLVQPPLFSSMGSDIARPGTKNPSAPFSRDGGAAGRLAATKRQPVSDRDLLRSTDYTDSGKASVDRNGAIFFYKMAIGANKYNLDAWYGLLAAYTALGMDDEARAAKAEMALLFGEEIFSISKTVGRFGDVVDTYTTTDGACYIEYRSRESGDDRLLHETFMIAKAFGAGKDCPAFSFYVHAAKGRGGVLAYVSAAPVPDSYQQYRSQVKATFF